VFEINYYYILGMKAVKGKFPGVWNPGGRFLHGVIEKENRMKALQSGPGTKKFF